jgi:hypothetical protein
MKLRNAMAAGLLAAGLISVTGVAAEAQSPSAMQPNSVQKVCAQDVYIRNQPAGVVIGTLVNGESFDHTRSDSSDTWWYGYAYGHANEWGWALASAFHGC